jgi:hypothetical protein
VFAFSLFATIAVAADAPPDASAEATGSSAVAGSGIDDGTNIETGDERGDVPTDAQQRELGSNEDPMAVDQARREAERAEKPEKTEERRGGIEIYGSARIRYRDQTELHEWQDGGSRIGVNLDRRILPESFLYLRYEAGFKLLTGFKKYSNPGDNTDERFDDTVFTRLLYVGIDTPNVNYVAGKNWSTYYKVGYFTDRFMGTGGSASGTFNAQTDGGPTGPGRADNTLQTHFSIDFLPAYLIKPFELNAQVQHGNPIPFGDGADYGTAYGLSAVMTTRHNFTLGLAYNDAQIDLDENPSLRRVGLAGDAQALLVGTRGFGDHWYAGLVAARLQNHETTDDGIYFDGWGSELYLQYRVTGPVWFVGGYNVLEPDANDVLARDYRVRYAIAGLRYSFDGFRRMLFAHVRIDDSLNADGTPGSDVFTIGIRWDFSKREWHRSD